MTAARKLILYGAGGHGLVVAEAAVAAGWQVLGFIDDRPEARSPGNWPMLERSDVIAGQAALHVAIGDNAARRRVAQLRGLQRSNWATVVHPAAVVSPTAELGPGVFISAGAVVNAMARIAEGVVINSGAVVEHDCRVHAFAHVGPRVVLCGEVTVGEGALVGAGAVVLPKRQIGPGAVVGAAALVTHDVQERTTAIGVPAKTVVGGPRPPRP